MFDLRVVMPGGSLTGKGMYVEMWVKRGIVTS